MLAAEGELATVAIGDVHTEAGAVIQDAHIAYRRWGAPRGDLHGKNNILIVEHALTGDSDASDWWCEAIGPGKALDTDEWCVICTNALGSCYGSTGPASEHPDGGVWGSRFPAITMRDMVHAERAFLEQLGISRVHAIIGGSMGGARTLEWTLLYPEAVDYALVLAVSARASAWQIGIQTAQICAVETDPDWQNGDYYDTGRCPDRGLGAARRIAHLTYRGERELDARFGSAPQKGEEPFSAYRNSQGRFAVESYLDHQARKLLQRFDAGTYVALTHAVNRHDVGRERGGVKETLASITIPVLVAGVVNGRNVWRTDLSAALERLEGFRDAGARISVATSNSLIHVPHTLEAEPELDPEIRSWLAFADEKLAEIQALVAGEEGAKEAFAQSDRAVRTRAESTTIHNKAVVDRVAALPEGAVKREPAFKERNKVQREELGLPTLPITTIGSFPQTTEIRKARADHREGNLSDAEYTEALKAEIKHVIDLQEEIGLDVLVHGEAERNDMVQYFAELLDGFVVTENGWVQSYGSRCTRPPIVVGDISRPAAMTTEWSKYAQSLSEHHVKGMLTGPVTILAWSFVRDDVHQSVSADQLGVALADEVHDLEEAGIDIIQIDEPALRELLPLREEDRKAYLDWAVRSFRLVALEAKPTTQIHTHLCYSEFGQIIDAVAGLDADVTSIEAARSRMELLEDIDETFHSEIGPGIYDIHSPRVPSVAEMAELIRAALKHVPVERLWVNPDCGLKTRGYEETEASLRNMVLARDEVRESL